MHRRSLTRTSISRQQQHQIQRTDELLHHFHTRTLLWQQTRELQLGLSWGGGSLDPSSCVYFVPPPESTLEIHRKPLPGTPHIQSTLPLTLFYKGCAIEIL